MKTRNGRTTVRGELAAVPRPSPARGGRPGEPRVTVVVPAYNEAMNLPRLFARLPPDLHEVIVVDGGSLDDTSQVARYLRPDVRIVRQDRKGRGNALCCGFAYATGDIVVMLDPDGSADPQDIPRLVTALTGGADFAKGTRFPRNGHGDVPRTGGMDGRWLNWAAYALYGTWYTDLWYGYNAFWARCLPALELDPCQHRRGRQSWGDGFEIDAIINARMARAGMCITEVPSSDAPRPDGGARRHTWRQGARMLAALVVERLRR